MGPPPKKGPNCRPSALQEDKGISRSYTGDKGISREAHGIFDFFGLSFVKTIRTRKKEPMGWIRVEE
jgi:hypothetical protein